MQRSQACLIAVFTGTLIASQALALNATLVTNNQKHFSKAHGLRAVNWV